MKKIFFHKLFFSLVILSVFVVACISISAATTYCSSSEGSLGNGYDYENWTSSGIRGTACMTTYGNAAAFKSEWNITAYGFVHQCGKDFIKIPVDSVSQNASVYHDHTLTSVRGAGNTGIYGWLLNPLIEYYVVEDWFGYRPQTANYKGQITVDGGTYDVYFLHKTNAPNYTGRNADFDQWWSVRTSTRTSGTISLAKHFQAWRNYGMSNGELQNIVFYTEPDVWNNGAYSQATVDYTTATIDLSGGATSPSPVASPTPTVTPTPTPTSSIAVTPTPTPTPSATPTPVGGQLFFDGFESGNFTAGGWTISGATITSAYKYAGTYSATIKTTGNYIQKSISTVGKSSVSVKCAVNTLGFSGTTGKYLYIEWYNGSAWQTIEAITTYSNGWLLKVYNLPSGAANNANFRLRFRIDKCKSNPVYIDNVEILG